MPKSRPTAGRQTKGRRAQSPRTSGPSVRRPGNDDLELWAEITRSVRPLKKRSSDRPRPARTDPEAEPDPTVRAATQPASRHRRHATPVTARDAGRDTQVAKPIEPKLRRKLARGRLAIDSTLDLHGMRQSEAHRALTHFVAAAAARGDRTILVITGKGLTGASDSPFGHTGVLRRAVPGWLSEPAIAALIAGFGPAGRGHGGGGALYVRLKRLKP